MDKLASKKRLYAGLGDYARQRRMQDMRKKYGTGSPELDAVAASQDEAVESAQLPGTKRSPIDVSDVDSGAAAAGPAMDDAMAAMAEDEEMQKWMAKQKG